MASKNMTADPVLNTNIATALHYMNQRRWHAETVNGTCDRKTASAKRGRELVFERTVALLQHM